MAVIALPRPIIWCLSSLHSLSQKWDSVKTAAGHRVDAVRAKIAPIQNKIGQNATYCWNQLTPSAQRHIQLIWTRDAGRFVGMDASYQKNILENVGDWFLYPSVDLPKQCFLYQNIPLGVGIASIGGAFFFLNFVFSPKATVFNTARHFSFVAGFLAKMSLIGLLFRSLGRWTNPQLMYQFQNPAPQNPR